MQKNAERVVVLGTGGTIAGAATQPGDNVGYTAAQIGASELVAPIPPLAGLPVEVEQVAQLDSKNMSFAVWRELAVRAAHNLARADVAGLVVTHGTDTLEETAYFLQRVLAPVKPVVLTAAMRPTTALLADGPQNLLDAVRVASSGSASGVVVVLGGRVHSGLDVRKMHTYRLDPFESGDAGPIARIEEGKLRTHRPWPSGEAFGLARLPADTTDWPWVEIVTSHANARPDGVDALCAAGVHGIVAAGSGNGSLHHELEAALHRADSRGVFVLRSTRCLNGALIDPVGVTDRLPGAGSLTPVQARIELMLQILDSSQRPAL